MFEGVIDMESCLTCLIAKFISFSEERRKYFKFYNVSQLKFFNVNRLTAHF